MNKEAKLEDLLDTINSNEFIVVASRPKMGKSTLGYNIINKVSKRTNGNILYFNLQTSKDSLKSIITDNNVEIIDTPNITIEEIRSKCESTKDLSFVVIDYFEAISSSSNDISFNQLSYIPRILKTIVIELSVPIIVLSQLTKEIEDRENKRPILADFYWSSPLTQDADRIIFLYRENYYNKQYELNDIELITAKNRYGPIGTVRMFFDDKGSSIEYR